MKLPKILRLNTFLLGVILVSSIAVSAQTYKKAAGLMIDVGDGNTMVGPHVKMFFQPNHAGEASVLFGNGLTQLQLNYMYNQQFASVPELTWYLGIGPSLYFPRHGDVNVGLQVPVGLDYKIDGTPIALFTDWRPRFLLRKNSDFNAARFGLGLRFAF